MARMLLAVLMLCLVAAPNIAPGVAHAQSPRDRDAEIAQLRAAAAQNDPKALLDLYYEHNSFGRGDVNRVPRVSRAEAEQALRRAAELGYPEAMWRLAILLNRGTVVKRDAAGARLWAARALANPPRDTRPSDIQVQLGHWLSKSDNTDERKRGIEILEALAKGGRGDAQAWLALALRQTDPVRARALLETALRTYPGHALALLSDMLIKGEGGPRDEKRALALLQGRSAVDAQQAKAALGQLVLEGRLLRRDVAEAVRLLSPWSQWDLDIRFQIARLLAENPEIKFSHASHFLYDVTEAAELGEPGAADALIALKLSSHPQFSDKAGGCALAERAVKRGDAIAAASLDKCRNN